MEQDTGVEPAFTAWEAVVLPIYESCMVVIIADREGKFNCFLSAENRMAVIAFDQRERIRFGAAEASAGKTEFPG